MTRQTYTLMAVHAHPDDESSSTGGLLRLAAEQGHTTILVTCTNGALGEVHIPDLRLNPRQDSADRQRLARIRQAELAKATAILGVTKVYLLGYHDSGMAGWDSNQERQAFVQAHQEAVTGQLVHIIRRHRPEVVVTYDANGGYGHPDHIMTHRVTLASIEAAAVAERFPEGGAPWQVRKVYYVVWARSSVRRAIMMMQVLDFFGLHTPLREPHFDPDTFGCPDELITTRIDVRPVLRAKWTALCAHRSQMGRTGKFLWFFQLGSRWFWPYETFRCVQSIMPAQQPESDIFAGL
jgi:N-acetyl-1-D-myo-inositol-2-amino-2-deoxy-alpha-D-glucopyranoside deacetylase/mycothiol S-conjugate amidase